MILIDITVAYLTSLHHEIEIVVTQGYKLVKCLNWKIMLSTQSYDTRSLHSEGMNVQKKTAFGLEDLVGQERL